MRLLHHVHAARVFQLMNEREIIENVKRTALRCCYQILLAFLDGQVSDGNNRKIKLHRLPVGAIVKRNIETCFSSRVEQAAAVWIFAYHPCECGGGDTGDNLFPGLAEVVSLVKI